MGRNYLLTGKEMRIGVIHGDRMTTKKNETRETPKKKSEGKIKVLGGISKNHRKKNHITEKKLLTAPNRFDRMGTDANNT